MTQYNVWLVRYAIADCLKIVDPKTCKFYLRPKLHEKDNACRPVVGSVNCNTFRILEHVDHDLQQKQ